jgi:hypothetical protein
VPAKRGIRQRLDAWWRRAGRRYVSVQPRDVASPGLSWGSERIPPVDAK